MVTAARARQVLQEGKIAGHRAARAPTRGAAHHAASLISPDISTRQLVMLITQGTVVGLCVLVVLAGVWFLFGDHLRARLTTLGTGAGIQTTGGASTAGPTVFYRDRGDGTVLVMEIDGNGTRIRGTLKRTDVPMMQETHEWSRKWDDNAHSTQSRINALGSAFR